MVFRNKFYFVESSVRGDGSASYLIRLNADHGIFRAHFPGDPVTPGVCILQMGLELLSDAVGEKVELSRAKTVKFLHILRPDDGLVEVRISRMEKDGGALTASIDFLRKDLQLAKMTLVCRITVK